jgi:precorrin-6B methylase 2
LGGDFLAFIWTENSIKWFEAAAEKSDYYQKIVQSIEFTFDNDGIIYDLGCGTGYLSIALASRAKEVIAIDQNQRVLNFLEKKCHEKHIENIKTLKTDWKQLSPKALADVVILSYCNGAIEHLETLLSLSKKYVVIVLAKSNQENSFNIREYLPNFSTYRSKRESAAEVIDYFRQNNIAYSSFSLSAEFGQPLDSREAAKGFVKHYFECSDEATDAYLDTHLKLYRSAYYLPYIKNSEIIILTK